jgi:hypothetical protein
MARFDRWSPELEAALAEPFPREWIKTKRVSGRDIAFVHWHLYAHRLNELVGPGWSMGEPILREVGGKLVMGVALTIFGVTRTNFGSEDEEHGNAEEVDDGKGGTKKVVRDFGSAETNAFAQAFKRACSLFGLGLALYDKDGLMRRPSTAASAPKPPDERHVLYIRTVGPSAPEDAQIRTNGKDANLREWTNKHWSKIKTEAVYALAAVRAIEAATGVPYEGPWETEEATHA